MEYALVAINLPVKNLTKQFLYYLPAELSHVGPGWRVLVPFGSQQAGRLCGGNHAEFC
jgi:primosomal protein N' (replication factor Y)